MYMPKHDMLLNESRAKLIGQKITELHVCAMLVYKHVKTEYVPR